MPGDYYLRCGSLCSHPFRIEESPYQALIPGMWKLIYGMRSGCRTPLHGVSHLDDAIMIDEKGSRKHYDLAGGYYDACDVRRYPGNCARVAESCCNAIEFGMLEPRMQRYLLEEALHAYKSMYKFIDKLDYIPQAIQEKSRKRGGVDTHNNLFTDNVVGTKDDRSISHPKSRPMEVYYLFLKSAAQISWLLKERAPYESDRILRQALSLWKKFKEEKYWKKIGLNPKNAEQHEIISLHLQTAIYLHKLTKDEKFKEVAIECAQKLIKCQNRLFYSGCPYLVTGKFSTGIGWHTTRSHPERGAAALADICETFPNHPDFLNWYSALRIHAEFLTKPIHRWVKPYGIPIMNFPAPGENLREYESPKSFAEKSIKRNPLCGHMNLLYARIREAQALKDVALEQVAIEQLGWTMGVNPFAICCYYKIGSDSISQAHCMHGAPVGTPNDGIAIIKKNGMNVPMYIRDVMMRNGVVPHEVGVRKTARTLQAIAMLSNKGLLAGRITQGGKGWLGTLEIFDRWGNKIRTWSTDREGHFGPMELPSGTYLVKAEEVKREISIISSTKQQVNFDLMEEIKIEANLPEVLEIGKSIPLKLKISTPPQNKFLKTNLCFFGDNVVVKEGKSMELRLNPRKVVELDRIVKGKKAERPYLLIVYPEGRWEDRIELFGKVKAEEYESWEVK